MWARRHTQESFCVFSRHLRPKHAFFFESLERKQHDVKQRTGSCLVYILFFMVCRKTLSGESASESFSSHNSSCQRICQMYGHDCHTNTPAKHGRSPLCFEKLISENQTYWFQFERYTVSGVVSFWKISSEWPSRAFACFFEWLWMNTRRSKQARLFS